MTSVAGDTFRRLEGREVEWTPGQRDRLRLSRETILEGTIFDDRIESSLFLKHFFLFHLDFVRSLAAGYRLAVSYQNRTLLWFPTSATSSFAKHT